MHKHRELTDRHGSIYRTKLPESVGQKTEPGRGNLGLSSQNFLKKIEPTDGINAIVVLRTEEGTFKHLKLHQQHTHAVTGATRKHANTLMEPLRKFVPCVTVWLTSFPPLVPLGYHILTSSVAT